MTGVRRTLIEAVARGEAQFTDLTPEERKAAHALIDARIRERADAARIGELARTAGRPAVVLDEHGRLIEINSDGHPRRL